MQETIENSRRCKLLIIEDDSADLFLLERALRSASIDAVVAVEIKHCENGLEGLSSIALGDLTQRLPDVVVVDLNMPIMGGELFLRRLRIDFELLDVPAIVLTTTNERVAHAAARSVGADYVFAKPPGFDDLVAIAGRIINIATKSGRAAPRRVASRRVPSRRA